MSQKDFVPENKFRIVSMSPEYIGSFYEALDTVAREEKYLAFVKAPSKNEVEEFVRYNLERDQVMIVALEGEKVIGWCDIITHQLPGFTHSGRLGMGIVCEYRRIGIGSRLLCEAINRAKRKGLIRIELEVFSSNIAAINLYKKYRFVFEGRKSRARYYKGTFDDFDLMALLI
jgi:ribosomal protein S18 acetylase RimI-like enzyme